MCSSYSSLVLVVFLGFSNFLLRVEAQLSGAKVPAVFAFGDSVLDTGNNNYLRTALKCNWRPYGRNFNGGEPTGRCSDGRLPSDILAEELGVKQLLPPYLDPNLRAADLVTGVCFASGASGYDPLSARLMHVLGLPEQLNLFSEYKDKLKAIVGEHEANNIISNGYYAVMSGSDDLVNTYPIRLFKYNVPEYIDLMLQGALSFLEALCGAGARHIYIFSLPPIGCMPSQRTIGGGFKRKCNEKANRAAISFNSKLKPALDKLNAKLEGGKVIYVDVYEPLLNLILNPGANGFTVANKGCCGTGAFEVDFLCNKFTRTTCQDVSKYIFWDSYHPTERAYKTLVKQMVGKYM